MKILACLFLLIATSTLIFSQRPASERAAAMEREPKAAADQYEASLNKIRTKFPNFDESVLNCDRVVIETTLPTVTEKFRTAGLTPRDATEATFNGWENVRLYSPLPESRCMAQVSFEKYVGTLGRMHFRSYPSGATIELNSKPLNQNTDSKRWFEPKEYKVRYSKPDCCLPVERTCTITENAETDCFAELPRKP